MNTFLSEIVNNEALVKLCYAAIAGLIIGFERELKGKPLGLKTCLIVSVTACLLAIVSIEAAFLYSAPYARPMDAGRIPSYVISGIGFLGAGVILRRNNDVISGLTTAALVLSSAGLGITIGAGFYVEALIAVILIMLGVQIIPALIDWIGPKRLKIKEVRTKLLVAKETNIKTLVEEVEAKFGLRRLKVKEELDHIAITCYLLTNKKIGTTEIYYELKKIDNIDQVEVENVE